MLQSSVMFPQSFSGYILELHDITLKWIEFESSFDFIKFQIHFDNGSKSTFNMLGVIPMELIWLWYVLGGLVYGVVYTVYNIRYSKVLFLGSERFSRMSSSWYLPSFKSKSITRMSGVLTHVSRLSKSPFTSIQNDSCATWWYPSSSWRYADCDLFHIKRQFGNHQRWSCCCHFR